MEIITRVYSISDAEIFRLRVNYGSALNFIVLDFIIVSTALC
jgi:hypothetical protein